MHDSPYCLKAISREVSITGQVWLFCRLMILSEKESVAILFSTEFWASFDEAAKAAGNLSEIKRTWCKVSIWKRQFWRMLYL